jgi:hypothetical protein
MATGFLTDHIFNIGVDVRDLNPEYAHPVVSVTEPIPMAGSYQVLASDCTIDYEVHQTESTVATAVFGMIGSTASEARPFTYDATTRTFNWSYAR